MSERGARRGAGAPFYAPLRRKTSAEIISEARAAIYGEMSGTSSGAGGVPGGLRPLRTRRPYTPREPQRSLFTDASKKEPRPPSSYDLKFLSLSESSEETLSAMDARIAHMDEETLNEMLADTHNTRRKPVLRKETRAGAPGDWGGFTKLPHLSGRSKPLHRRNTTGQVHPEDPKAETNLGQAILVTRPLGDVEGNYFGSPTLAENLTKSLTPEVATKRKQFASTKAASCDASSGGGGVRRSDIDVKHLAVQLPNTSGDSLEHMTTLELSEALSQRSRDTQRTLLLLDAVIVTVQTSPPSGSLREMLLRSLYAHADSDDERVLVAVARAMLTMRVTGAHLAAACKLVFKIAQNNKNDHFFRNTNLLELLVEGCGRAEPVSESACCVYGCAALRVLALEPGLAARAHRAGAAHLAALHLKILNNAKAESPRSLNEQSTHALYQVTGALRSLAGAVDRFAHEFLASGALPELLFRSVLEKRRWTVIINAAKFPCSLNEQSTHALYQVTGALRSLAGAVDRFAHEFLASGALPELMCLVLPWRNDGGVANINTAKFPCSLNELSTHALYPVTGALRSLAGAVNRFAHEFLASGALPELVNALGLHTDRDVLTNVARYVSCIALEKRRCTVIINTAKFPCSLNEQSTHALYQVTGALRSLAGAVDRLAHEFLASGALPELVNALGLHTDRDVLTNVARCLSVVSGSTECCAWLCGASGAARQLVRSLAACAPRAPLAVRLAYTLGNMAAADERVRNDIYNEDGAIDVLLTILESYSQRNPQDPIDVETDPDLHLVGSDLGGSDGSNEDVLIKTVRVLANLCLAERVGRGLADLYAERIVNALLACLQLAEKIVLDTDMSSEENAATIERGEELATAALATLNNLTFYREPPDPPDPLHVSIDNICKALATLNNLTFYREPPDPPDPLHVAIDNICKALATLNNLTFYREPPDPPDPLHVAIDNICKATCRWLRGSGPASCEAVRALGNVTRAARTAQLIVLEGALDSLEPFLQHEDCSVRCAAAGLLVNVCGAGCECAAAAALVARALGAAAQRRDVAPAPLLARALWNAHAHDNAPLSPANAHRVSEALAAFIDDDSAFAACEAAKMGDRCDGDQSIVKHHVTFDMENNNYASECDPSCYAADPKRLARKGSLEPEDGDVTGEDLGFEEGDVEECLCDPCRRLASWDELAGVAIPLMERLRPPRTDASVGTE
ncbi:hypothetical protein PYW07_008635 [Mythimna separata]|uniref:Armadillo repeat-containing protein 2 n=1 Tax=Mythimna separata TaxID=271217 RepID=A0AAD8DNV8_MYTSE|nr:hypothetical protein PYW07_008635 [Mythimna separata]